eukprot:m.141239 g.141239  ORF g.141239 m.141239 type:complete len:966 (-) comp14842_c0_seq4:66-2963(-)
MDTIQPLPPEAGHAAVVTTPRASTRLQIPMTGSKSGTPRAPSPPDSASSTPIRRLDQTTLIGTSTPYNYSEHNQQKPYQSPSFSSPTSRPSTTTPNYKKTKTETPGSKDDKIANAKRRLQKLRKKNSPRNTPSPTIAKGSPIPRFSSPLSSVTAATQAASDISNRSTNSSPQRKKSILNKAKDMKRRIEETKQRLDTAIEATHNDNKRPQPYDIPSNQVQKSDNPKNSEDEEEVWGFADAPSTAPTKNDLMTTNQQHKQSQLANPPQIIQSQQSAEQLQKHMEEITKLKSIAIKSQHVINVKDQEVRLLSTQLTETQNRETQLQNQLKQLLEQAAASSSLPDPEHTQKQIEELQESVAREAAQAATAEDAYRKALLRMKELDTLVESTTNNLETKTNELRNVQEELKKCQNELSQISYQRTHDRQEWSRRLEEAETELLDQRKRTNSAEGQLLEFKQRYEEIEDENKAIMFSLRKAEIENNEMRLQISTQQANAEKEKAQAQKEKSIAGQELNQEQRRKKELEDAEIQKKILELQAALAVAQKKVHEQSQLGQQQQQQVEAENQIQALQNEVKACEKKIHVLETRNSEATARMQGILHEKQQALEKVASLESAASRRPSPPAATRPELSRDDLVSSLKSQIEHLELERAHLLEAVHNTSSHENQAVQPHDRPMTGAETEETPEPQDWPEWIAGGEDGERAPSPSSSSPVQQQVQPSSSLAQKRSNNEADLGLPQLPDGSAPPKEDMLIVHVAQLERELQKLKREHEDLLSRYTQVSEEKVDLTRRVRKEEQLTTQLAKETDTIGEYIALYHDYRKRTSEVLKEKEVVIADLTSQNGLLLNEIKALENDLSDTHLIIAGMCARIKSAAEKVPSQYQPDVLRIATSTDVPARNKALAEETAGARPTQSPVGLATGGAAAPYENSPVISPYMSGVVRPNASAAQIGSKVQRVAMIPNFMRQDSTFQEV